MAGWLLEYLVGYLLRHFHNLQLLLYSCHFFFYLCLVSDIIFIVHWAQCGLSIITRHWTWQISTKTEIDIFMENILLFGCKPPASSEFSPDLACEWPALFLALHLLIYFLARADIMDHKILIKYLLCCLMTYPVKPLVHLRKLQIG